jgi:hypothetical protein
MLKRYAEIAELDRQTVTSLVHTVYISEPIMEGKKKAYDIEIRYKFQNPHRVGLEAKKENALTG